MYDKTHFRRAAKPRYYRDMHVVFGPHLTPKQRHSLLPDIDWSEDLKAYVVMHNDWTDEQVVDLFNQKVAAPETLMSPVIEAAVNGPKPSQNKSIGTPDPVKATRWRNSIHLYPAYSDAILAVADAIDSGSIPLWADIRIGDLMEYVGVTSWSVAAIRFPYLKGGNDAKWNELRDRIAELTAVAPSATLDESSFLPLVSESA